MPGQYVLCVTFAVLAHGETAAVMRTKHSVTIMSDGEMDTLESGNGSGTLRLRRRDAYHHGERPGRPVHRATGLVRHANVGGKTVPANTHTHAHKGLGLAETFGREVSSD